MFGPNNHQRFTTGLGLWAVTIPGFAYNWRDYHYGKIPSLRLAGPEQNGLALWARWTRTLCCQSQIYQTCQIEWQTTCQIACQTTCQNMCQNLCQIEWQIEYQIWCQIILEIKWQTECRKICQIKCQLESDRKSAYVPDQCICQIKCRFRENKFCWTPGNTSKERNICVRWKICLDNIKNMSQIGTKH